jgi:FSR family fosmidomycin resistance protein-like MFS transporter
MNNKRLFAASYGHFSIDILNSSIPIILTAVAIEFNLNISQIGLAAMIYTFAASLTQPLFGFLVDKVQGRWIAGIGLTWTMFFYSAAPFMPNYPLLVTCLALGALGSGAFHPAGMINATMAGGFKPTTATSLFFVGGQSGLALGPTLSGVLIQRYGLTAMPFVALAMAPAAIYMLWLLRHPDEDLTAKAVAHTHTHHAAHTAGQADAQPPAQVAAESAGLLVIVAFILLITFRSTTQQGFTTLLPKYFADQGYTPAIYGLMLSVLGFAGAFGTLLGGWLGDRYNRRMIIFISMSLGAFFSFGMLHTAGLFYVIVALGAGMMMNVPHSIMIIMAQRLIPARKGMIGGAVLGLMFASGAAMTGVASWIADFSGLPIVLNVIAFMPFAAGLCALLLPSTRGAVALPPAQNVEAPAPAGD